MSGQRPLVAEGVLELAIAIAPEHVLDGHGGGGTGIDCLLVALIYIFDIRMKCNRTAIG